MRTLRIALAQVNTTVGDFGGNLRRIKDAIARAEALGAELIAFPEQTIPGYPAEDLLLRSDFIDANRRALAALAKDVTRSVVVVGVAVSRRRRLQRRRGARRGRGARHLPQAPPAQLRRLRREALLPAGRASRSSSAAATSPSASTSARTSGTPTGPPRRRPASGGAELLLVLSASPYFTRQDARARAHAAPRAPRTTSPASPTSTWWAARTSWSSTARA